MTPLIPALLTTTSSRPNTSAARDTAALIALQTLYVEPTSVFNIQYSVYMLFMVLVGGMGTIEGPVLGALVLFGLQEALSSRGSWYLVIVGGGWR